MCAIDGGDTYEVYTRERRRARKQHKCGECLRPIVPGEQYSYSKGLYDGFWYTHHTCDHCGVAQEWLRINCGGFLYQGVLEDIEQHADEYPALRLSLSRLVVGMRRDWHRFDRSGLMRLPKLPPRILPRPSAPPPEPDFGVRDVGL